MTMYDAYICERGDMAEDLEFETSLPIRRSPWFPPPGGNDNFLTLIFNMEHTQIEWGGYVTIVTKNQLSDILDAWYGKLGRRLKPKYYPHLFEQYTELRAYVESLDGRKKYGLVGTEF